MHPFIDIHTHKSHQDIGVISIQSLSLTSNIFLPMPKLKPIAVGLHPWYAKANSLATDMKFLNVVAKQHNVKLIGECGLDKLKGEEVANQLEILTAQINLAQTLNKPVILHCVKAFDELIALKKKLNPSIPLIIHGFNKKPEMAKQLLKNGFLLSFGAAVLSNESLLNFVKEMDTPFFLETDDAAIHIEEVYNKIAEVKKIAVNELKDIIFANCKNLNLF